MLIAQFGKQGEELHLDIIAKATESYRERFIPRFSFSNDFLMQFSVSSYEGESFGNRSPFYTTRHRLTFVEDLAQFLAARFNHP